MEKEKSQVEAIIESISKLSVLELAELVKSGGKIWGFAYNGAAPGKCRQKNRKKKSLHMILF